MMYSLRFARAYSRYIANGQPKACRRRTSMEARSDGSVVIDRLPAEPVHQFGRDLGDILFAAGESPGEVGDRLQPIKGCAGKDASRVERGQNPGLPLDVRCSEFNERGKLAGDHVHIACSGGFADRIDLEVHVPVIRIEIVDADLEVVHPAQAYFRHVNLP